MSRCTHWLRRPRPHADPRRRRAAGAALLTLILTSTPATVEARQNPVPKPPTNQQVTTTLQALDRLHQFGYTVNTAARAETAIRHWQRANGLTVDGKVGPETLASLTLAVDATAQAPAHNAFVPAPTADPLARGATATVPAVRTTPPPPLAPADSVEQLIRDIWPDPLEDRALAIAYRESRLQPTVRTWCCYGLFQIHHIHLAWLCPDLGICTTTQLYDPNLNVRAALALYQRDGWQPWTP